MTWKTGQKNGEYVGWSPAQLQRKRRRQTLDMAKQTFDVVVASHQNLRDQPVMVRIVDRRASRGKIVCTFNDLEATKIIRYGATVRLERDDTWQGSTRFQWYVHLEATAFDVLVERAGVAPEQIHGWCGPEPTPLPPAPTPPDFDWRDQFPYRIL